MKIIIVGATGTMGTHLVNALEKEHEIIKVATSGAPHAVSATVDRLWGRHLPVEHWEP